MKIDVDVDAAKLLLRLEGGEKRFAFAVVNAINATAKAVQADVREHVKKQFTLRRSEFVLREAAVISPFASVSQGRPYAEVGVGSPGRPKPRFLLSQFEEGGPRAPIKGKQSIAVPVIGGPARPSFAQSVPDAFRFTRLGLRLTPRTEGARRKRTVPGEQPVRYGLLGTYQVPGVGVFQRVAGEASRLVYAFVRSEQLPSTLDFEAVARATSDRVFRLALESEIDDVLIRRGLTRSSLGG